MPGPAGATKEAGPSREEQPYTGLRCSGLSVGFVSDTCRATGQRAEAAADPNHSVHMAAAEAALAPVACMHGAEDEHGLHNYFWRTPARTLIARAWCTGQLAVMLPSCGGSVACTCRHTGSNPHRIFLAQQH